MDQGKKTGVSCTGETAKNRKETKKEGKRNRPGWRREGLDGGAIYGEIKCQDHKGSRGKSGWMRGGRGPGGDTPLHRDTGGEGWGVEGEEGAGCIQVGWMRDMRVVHAVKNCCCTICYSTQGALHSVPAPSLPNLSPL